ncbi:hypothetical protein EDD15DRAFT_2223541 [Pisolithus albus]|nr:hypothetical protein EDD15DRAFT_2223541 [Pisolithus albus]
MSSEPSPNHQPEDHPHTRIEEDGLGNQATDHDTTDAGDEGHFIGAGDDHNSADQQVVGQGDELANTDGMPKLQHSMSSVQAIRNASLDDGIGLTGGALEQLRTPPKEPLRIDDPYMELASTIFIELENSPEESEETYEKIRKAIERCFPDSELLSFHQTKRLLTDPSGVTDTKMG